MLLRGGGNGCASGRPERNLAYEAETVKFLQEVKERAERNELTWLKEHGKVYAALEAA